MRGIFSGLVMAVAALAAAQNGNAGADDGNLAPFVAGILVVAIFVLGFLAFRKPKPALPAAGVVRGKDEVTKILIAGPRLIRIQGGVKVGADVPVNSVIVVGADPSSSIHFEDAGLSPSHAEFRPESGATVVVDLNSTAGTYVNEARITADTPHPLADGDKIRLGELVLQFRANA